MQRYENEGKDNTSNNKTEEVQEVSEEYLISSFQL